jgi:hypothetical protein
MELHKEQGMVYEQRKEAYTGRRLMALSGVSAECSGVRLRVLLSECNIAPMDFALFLKISPQRLTNWFSRGIPQSQFDNIARLLSVSAYWLETGEGEKFLATRE